MIKITIDDEPASEHISKLKQKMSDYMTQGNTHNEENRFAKEGFNDGGIYSLNDNDANLTAEKTLEGAIKIRNTVLNRGEIATDAAVENACPVTEIAADAKAKPTQYYLNAGPVASTHPQLEWRTAWRLEPDAPAYKSDEWKAEASELEIPEREKFMPKVVRRFYEYLEDVQQKDGRPAHRGELIHNSGARLRERQYDKAFRYLEEFSGIVPPKRDGPAWEAVEQQQVEETATGEVNV